MPGIVFGVFTRRHTDRLRLFSSSLQSLITEWGGGAKFILDLRREDGISCFRDFNKHNVLRNLANFSTKLKTLSCQQGVS
jgi:hypothetical protein